jgi:phenylalanyl-tRNA synthetase beta chain
MQADIILQGKNVGTFGILHPNVLENFNWLYPTSLLELKIEFLIDFFYTKRFG